MKPRTITNHTPGPWAISDRAKGLAIGGTRNTVCSIGFTDDQAKADAALIAAAPDLLQSLKTLAAMLPTLAPGSVADAFLADAMAVIDRAEGRTP